MICMIIFIAILYNLYLMKGLGIPEFIDSNAGLVSPGTVEPL